MKISTVLLLAGIAYLVYTQRTTGGHGVVINGTRYYPTGAATALNGAAGSGASGADDSGLHPSNAVVATLAQIKSPGFGPG